MKEFHLTMQLRNNLLRSRRVALGLNVRQLSDASGVSYHSALGLEAMRISPLAKRTNDWRPSVVKLAKFFKCEPGQLFPAEIMLVETSKVSAEVDAEKALALARISNTPLELPPTPEELLDVSEQVEELQTLLYELSERERTVIEMVTRGEDHAEIGRKLKVGRSRAGQIYTIALRKMRTMHHRRKQKFAIERWQTDLRRFRRKDDKPDEHTGALPELPISKPQQTHEIHYRTEYYDEHKHLCRTYCGMVVVTSVATVRRFKINCPVCRKIVVRKRVSPED
jgi:transcriptional regulator with XRE-family HTH domain